jgi:hypothetical protein
LDFGSSLFVNCIYLKNKKILILNNCGIDYQKDKFISINIICEIINNNNNTITINPNSNSHEIKFDKIKNLL